MAERRVMETPSAAVQIIPVEMGMLGMSLEDITANTKGYVKLPVGPRDLTMAGGRKWVKIQVRAMETVRAFRDIIVANDDGEVKEHTPVELSYERFEGGYQRVGEALPLPVVFGAGRIDATTDLEVNEYTWIDWGAAPPAVEHEHELYEVPRGYICFVDHIFLSGLNTNAGAAAAYWLRIRNEQGAMTNGLMYTYLGKATQANETCTANATIPTGLKLLAQHSIRLVADGGVEVFCNIHGWLVPT